MELNGGLGLCSEPALLVLLSLAGEALDERGITSRITAMGGTAPRRGTLYGALARLEADGLIECLPGLSPRRPYALTDAGRATLRHWLDGLRALVTDGLQRLAAVPSLLDLREAAPLEQPV